MASTLTILGGVALAGEVTFLTTHGYYITGEVVSSTINTLNVHQTDGGYDVIPRREIDRVGMEVEGGAIEGSFINWQDGRFTLRIDDRVVTVVDGVIKGEVGDVVQPALQEREPAEAAVQVIDDAASAEPPTPSVPIVEPTM